MTPEERAWEVCKWLDTEIGWRIQAEESGKPAEQLEYGEICAHIKQAIEEDRKSRECCKAEREACAGIVKKEIERWDRESVVELRESILHEIEIRARSEKGD